MSQVIVTQDSYAVARERSLHQEKQISTSQEFEKWHLSDVTKKYAVLRAVFIPVLIPVVLFWSLLMAGLSLAVFIVAEAMRFLGKVIGKV